MSLGGGTYRAEVRVLGNMLGHTRLRGRKRHDEQKGFSGLLTYRTLSGRVEGDFQCGMLEMVFTKRACVQEPVRVRDEQGEEQEVGGALIFAGVEEQFQH